ncbi:MAG TPA: hypothetical protein DHW14_01050 [Clostridiales bacterium]|nr:hypothetical protein [Clostridiales bacterium]
MEVVGGGGAGQETPEGVVAVPGLGLPQAVGEKAHVADAVVRTYDDRGRLTSETAPGDLVTRFEYDEAGRLVRRMRRSRPPAPYSNTSTVPSGLVRVVRAPGDASGGEPGAGGTSS